MWGPALKNPNPALSLGSSCPALPLPSLEQDAQTLLPHICPPDPPNTEHRESQEAECLDRDTDRVVVSRWRQLQPQGLEKGERDRDVAGILVFSHLSTPEPWALTSVPGVLPAQHPTAGPQGDTPWMKTDGQG